jgi:hypothetical protein
MPAKTPSLSVGGSLTDQVMQLESRCELKVVVRRLHDYLGHLRADVDSLTEGSNRFDALNDQPDVALVGSGSGVYGFGRWAVQIYLTARDEETSITLRAIGHDATARVVRGRRSMISLANSVKKLESLARLFRAMEEEAHMQGMDRP